MDITLLEGVKERLYLSLWPVSFTINVIMIWLTKSFVVFHIKDFYVAIKVEMMMATTIPMKRIRNKSVIYTICLVDDIEFRMNVRHKTITKTTRGKREKKCFVQTLSTKKKTET